MVQLFTKRNNAIKWQPWETLIRLIHDSGLKTNSWKTVHDDVIKWKHFPRDLPFVRGIHRLPANFPHKDKWRGTFVFSLICTWSNGWGNNRNAYDLRRHGAHYDDTAMSMKENIFWKSITRRYPLSVSFHENLTLIGNWTGYAIHIYSPQLIHLPVVPHLCVAELRHHWLRQTPVTEWVPSHFLNKCLSPVQCQVIINDDFASTAPQGMDFNENMIQTKQSFLVWIELNLNFCNFAGILCRGKWVEN